MDPSNTLICIIIIVLIIIIIYSSCAKNNSTASNNKANFALKRGDRKVYESHAPEIGTGLTKSQMPLHDFEDISGFVSYEDYKTITDGLDCVINSAVHFIKVYNTTIPYDYIQDDSWDFIGLQNSMATVAHTTDTVKSMIFSGMEKDKAAYLLTQVIDFYNWIQPPEEQQPDELRPLLDALYNWRQCYTDIVHVRDYYLHSTPPR